MPTHDRKDLADHDDAGTSGLAVLGGIDGRAPDTRHATATIWHSSKVGVALEWSAQQIAEGFNQHIEEALPSLWRNALHYQSATTMRFRGVVDDRHAAPLLDVNEGSLAFPYVKSAANFNERHYRCPRIMTYPKLLRFFVLP